MKKSLDLLYYLSDNDLKALDNSKIQKFLKQFQIDCLSIEVESGFDAEKINQRWLDEISPYKNDKVINVKSLGKINKIYDLLGQKGSDAANLFQFYLAINATTKINEAEKIMTLTRDYKLHLEKKLTKEDFNSYKLKPIDITENTPKNLLSLKERHEAIKRAYEIALNNKSGLEKEEKEHINECIKICANTDPGLSENHYINNLLSCLCLGTNMTHRGIFFMKIPTIKISMNHVSNMRLSFEYTCDTSKCMF